MKDGRNPTLKRILEAVQKVVLGLKHTELLDFFYTNLLETKDKGMPINVNFVALIYAVLADLLFLKTLPVGIQSAIRVNKKTQLTTNMQSQGLYGVVKYTLKSAKIREI